MTKPPILSIQSHVAYGHVGNRAATLPLQRLGHEVWAVNTVQFSNHTGYGSWTGEVFAPEHVAGLIDGISARGVLPACGAVLSGYLGSAALGAVVRDAADRVRRENPHAVWLCDPVMGDVGRGFFVPPDIPDFFRDVAVPSADLVTPNLFELEALTGIAPTDLRAALAGARALLARGPRLVLVTSAAWEAGAIGLLAVTGEGAWLVETPRVPVDPAPNGAGDATAALFLAHYLGSGGDARAALAATAAAIYEVFLATAEAGGRELALVAAQDSLVAPRQSFPAVSLTWRG